MLAISLLLIATQPSAIMPSKLIGGILHQISSKILSILNVKALRAGYDGLTNLRLADMIEEAPSQTSSEVAQWKIFSH